MYTKITIKFGHPPSHLACGKYGGLYIPYKCNWQVVKLCQIHPELEMLVFLLKVHIDLDTSQQMLDTKTTQRLVRRTLHNLNACHVNHHSHT